jgi:phosphoglycolate phosphatase-like HAD superfamily hydrolase
MLHDDIMRQNGKQTIYQMIQFAERIKERGGEAREALWYKNEYLRRLDQRIADRLQGLRSGALKPDIFLVLGARAVLENLRQRNVPLYLASGTDEPYVRREAQLLHIAGYFGKHIYGALDDYQKFSKKMVIERILRDNLIPGEQLLAFGDGYVEIQNTKEAGGLAVAVASDEANNGSGKMDEWKRKRLFGVGADVVIPDYRDASALLEIIFGR